MKKSSLFNHLAQAYRTIFFLLSLSLSFPLPSFFLNVEKRLEILDQETFHYIVLSLLRNNIKILLCASK